MRFIKRVGVWSSVGSPHKPGYPVKRKAIFSIGEDKDEPKKLLFFFRFYAANQNAPE